MSNSATPSYNDAFFEDQQQNSTQSARHVAPLVLDLVRPDSIIDVGCGVGAWLSVFREQGITDIYGIDGDDVLPERLLISSEHFVRHDLKKPYKTGREYDLAVCLEVAEHLPEENAGEFVESLVRLSPLVLFSAAVPGQGGVHHVNEQWQSYWAELFGARGYIPVDCFRSRLWKNNKVRWWYAQNMLLYVKETSLHRYPGLQNEQAREATMPLNVVHPAMYTGLVYHANPDNAKVGNAVKLLFTSLRNAIKRRALS